MHQINRAYAVAALVLLAVAAVVGQQAVGMRFYSFLGPGAGFFPAFLAGLLAILALILLYQAVRRPDTLPEVIFSADPMAYARLATVVASLLAIAVLIEDLGFLPSMIVFFVLMFGVLGRHKLWLSIGLSVTLSFAYHFFFKKLLNVPLPTGMFGI